MIGGIIALASMAYTWNGTLESASLIGLNMLVAVMFFAVAGCFTNYSPVKGTTIMILSALCAAFTVISMMFDAMLVWVGIVLVVLGIVNILFAACPTVTKWVDGNRIA